MDIRILDIDIENRTLYLIYDNLIAFEKAKRELYHIGYPIVQYTYQKPEPQTRSIKIYKMS